MNSQDILSHYQSFFSTLQFYFNTHFTFFITLDCILIFILTFFIFLQKRKKKETPQTNEKNTTFKPTKAITNQDIKAIAGDDMLTTQLDLARAYIEMDKKSLAKKILEHVLEHGDTQHQQEAKGLLSQL